MTNHVRTLWPLLAVASLALPARANDTAAAKELFDRGVSALRDGKHDEACPALEASFRLDQAPGTLFALAQCEALRGRVATAWSRYGDFVDLVATMPEAQQKRREGQVEAAKRARDELATRVPRLTITLAQPDPEVEVTRDGTVMSQSALGVALPIDPGKHRIVARKSGSEPVALDVEIAAGEQRSITIEPPRAPAPPAVAPQASTSASPASQPAAPAAPRGTSPSQAPTTSPLRTAGFVALGVGAAGVIAGSVTGALALGRGGVVSRECEGRLCSSEGKSAADEGKTLATISNVTFAVGGVGLGAGLLLLLLSPSTNEPRSTAMQHLSIAPSRGSLLVQAGATF